MLSRPGTISDDRGQRVPIFNAAAFERWPVAEDPRVRALCQRLEARHRSGHRFARLFLGLSTFAVVLAGGLLVSATAPSIPGWVIGLTLAIVLMPLLPHIVAFANRHFASEAAGIILDEGLCPSCGYNFVGLHRASDGCIECPECGAAWSGDRIRRTEPFTTLAGAPSSRWPILSAIGGGASARDDRRQPVMLIPPRMGDYLRGAPAEQRARLRAARRGYARKGVLVRFPVALFFVLLALGSMMLWFALPPVAGAAPFMLPAILFLALAAGVLFGNFAYSSRAIIRHMKAQRLCPSCAYDLSPSPPEPDGCTTCPQCRAAWRVPSNGNPVLEQVGQLPAPGPESITP